MSQTLITRRRAIKELAEDGCIHADTFMELTALGLDPSTIESNYNDRKENN